SLSLFGNVSLLHAEFVRGGNKGKQPAYAPDYVFKTGAIWRWKDRAKLALTGVFVGDHYWQDSNSAGSVGTDQIADYMVWDLTAEVRLYKDYVSLVGGIYNLFDEDYYSRIRSDGIDPAPRRNFYAGVKVTF
ncbi:MAG: TonB-dependent receptor, partial [Verrucomicrobiae bacterium]|nr:TonB-dependent receptor [Verrucomicrobiae bacterium]